MNQKGSEERERLSPRDKWITIFGRKPVLEALNDPALSVAKIIVADNAGGHSMDDIMKAAARTGTPVERATATRVKWLAYNGKHDQGVVADVNAPRMTPLAEFVRARGKRPTKVFLLDGVTNPGNVGMILRTATGAGFDGVILPKAGTPHVGPLVIKASAGVAFQAPIVNVATAKAAVNMLTGRAIESTACPRAPGSRSSRPTWHRARCSCSVARHTASRSPPTRTCRSRCTPAVESLNVAVAAAVVAFEVTNRD